MKKEKVASTDLTKLHIAKFLITNFLIYEVSSATKFPMLQSSQYYKIPSLNRNEVLPTGDLF
jgi:hypothetical protein